MTLSSSATWMAIALGLSLLGLGGHAHAQPAPRFKAVAFDYFVIFDANSIVPEVEMAFPGKSAEFTRIWRAKQFEYCYLRTITGRFADFSLVTEDALVYAAEAMHLELKGDTRQRLLNAYLNLKPWPDAADGLRKLRAAGVRIITISVFSGAMLRANAEHAGIADLFDELLSTEVNQTYKLVLRGLRRLGRLWGQELRLSDLLGEPLQRAGGRTGPEGRRHGQQFSRLVGFRAGEIGRVAAFQPPSFRIAAIAASPESITTDRKAGL